MIDAVEKSAAISPEAPANCGPLRILHVLDHSWPVLDGYSQRTQSLLGAQRELGFQPTALTSPLHQQDDAAATDVSLNGVTYRRTPMENGVLARAIRGRWPFVREAGVMRLLRRRIECLLDSEQFDIVHAHSPALCGLASLRACRSRAIPFVYEMRSFWEDSDISTHKTLWASLRYQLSRRLESFVLRRTDAIAGISASVLAEVAGRGIPKDRLFHIPNGVDAARFTPRARDISLARELQVENVPTLGYVGTFFPWEGISWLVRAAAELHRRGVTFKLLLIGDGADAESVKRAIAETDASNYIRYLGRVPHDRIEKYYSIVDVLVYPRLSTRITELVTPLKPLEAMALGKTVLASAVGGHRELITPNVTGFLFEPENVDDFCRAAAMLLRDPDLRNCGDQARRFVAESKSWKKIASGYEAVYQAALRNHARKSGAALIGQSHPKVKG